jgi:hypothetical protein
LSWGDRFRYDVWYVDNWSLTLDIRILAMTLWKAAAGQGIGREGVETMTEFEGSDFVGASKHRDPA